MLVYLSAPIDKADSGGSMRTFDEFCSLVTAAAGQPVVMFVPRYAFQVPGGMSKRDCSAIVGINEAALAMADVVVVFYVPNQETWGVPYEVYKAYELHKPVYLIVPDGLIPSKLPTYLRAFVGEPFIVSRDQLCTIFSGDMRTITNVQQHQVGQE